MPILHIERLGGLMGLGGHNCAIRSMGELDTQTLSPEDQAHIEALFAQTSRPSKASHTRDGLRYRLIRNTTTIEVPESELPQAVSECVEDRWV